MSEYGMSVKEFADLVYSDPLYTVIFFVLSFSFLGLLLYGLKPIKKNKSLDEFTKKHSINSVNEGKP